MPIDIIMGHIHNNAVFFLQKKFFFKKKAATARTKKINISILVNEKKKQVNSRSLIFQSIQKRSKCSQFIRMTNNDKEKRYQKKVYLCLEYK